MQLPTKGEMAGAKERALVGPALPYIDDELMRQEKALDLRTIQKVVAGTLTDAEASLAWREKAAIRQMRHHFRGKYGNPEPFNKQET